MLLSLVSYLLEPPQIFLMMLNTPVCLLLYSLRLLLVSFHSDMELKPGAPTDMIGQLGLDAEAKIKFPKLAQKR